MAPINSNLKKAFIVVDVIIGVLGTIWLVLSLFFHGAYHGDPKNDAFFGLQTFSVMYAIGIGIMTLAAMALYGVMKQKQWALIVFCVGMCVVTLLFLVVGIPSAVAADHTEVFLSEAFDETPLKDASEQTRQDFEEYQTMFQCCGFENGHSDWGDSIPKSCICSAPESTTQCVDVTIGQEKVSVYDQTCYPYLVELFRIIFQVLAGVSFSYVISVAFGLTLAIAILCQMRRKTITPPVTFTTHSSDSKYTELEATA
ncbi:tetraspanin-8-like [Engraulis encrasicolus]|uniref:tetraspanin-8-like n=1 Tax=Engraulis encrasicolus TaxID=184585 RepID=UPI002FD79834